MEKEKEGHRKPTTRKVTPPSDDYVTLRPHGTPVYVRKDLIKDITMVFINTERTSD